MSRSPVLFVAGIVTTFLLASAVHAQPRQQTDSELRIILNAALAKGDDNLFTTLDANINMRGINLVFSPAGLGVNAVARRQLSDTELNKAKIDLKSYLNQVWSQAAVVPGAQIQTLKAATINIALPNPGDGPSGQGTNQNAGTWTSPGATLVTPNPVGTGCRSVCLSSRPAYARTLVAAVPVQVQSGPITADEIASARLAMNGSFLVSSGNATAIDRPQDSQVANEFYGAGVHAYWDREYPRALELLTIACEFNSADARAWYFKGLTSQALGSREEAAQAFAHATALMVSNRAGRGAVEKALERVQGAQRLEFRSAEGRFDRVLPASNNQVANPSATPVAVTDKR